VRPHWGSKCQFAFGLRNDEQGFLVSKAEWNDQALWLWNKSQHRYGEMASVGPETAVHALRVVAELIEQK